MTSRRFQVTWKTILLPTLGLLAFFLYLYIFNVDIPMIIATVQGINFSIYFLAIVAVILETFFYTLSWRSLLNFLSVKLSVIKSFLYVWFGIFMDILIPAESISGEISRVYLVTKEQNGTSGKVVASLVTHRLMGMSVNIVSLFIGTIALIIQGNVTSFVLGLSFFLMVATTISLVLVILLCIQERWTLKIINATIRFAEYVTRGKWKLISIRENVVKAAKLFHNSMKKFGHAPKTLFISLFFHVLSWFLSLGVSYLVFLSMGFPIHWSVIIITWSIVNAVRAVPLGVPFEAGLPEITMSTLYLVLSPNMTLQIAATATILNRLLTVWFRFFIGFGVQQWLGITAMTITSTTNEIITSK